MSLRSEFQCTNFKFQHDKPDDIYSIKVFGVLHPSLWFVRLIFALYAVASFIYMYFVKIQSINMLIFLSNWGYILYTSYFLFGTICSGIHLFGKWDVRTNDTDVETSRNNLPIHVKCFWVLTNITLLTGGAIVILFWGFVYHRSLIVSSIDAYMNVNIHAVVYFLVFVDFVMFNMTPIRIVHVVYTFVFGIVYIIFSVIYTTSTGRWIYSVLDWNNNPGSSVLFVFMALAFIMFLQCLFYGIFQLKRRYSNKRREQSISTNVLAETI